MKPWLVGIACALLVSTTTYGQVPVGPLRLSSLSLGSEFVPVLVTCGTAQNSECPRFIEPVGQRFLIHYVTVSGRTNIQCSIAPVVERQRSDGTVERISLTRIALWGDNQESPSRLSSDSIVLTFPKPLLGEAGDTLGVTRTPLTTADTCSVFAMFGIEYLK